MTYDRIVFRLIPIVTVIVTIVVVLAAGTWILSEFPPGERFIDPLRQVSYVVSRAAYLPVSATLIVILVMTWPLLIQWGMARGDRPDKLLAPNLRHVFALIFISIVGFTLFRTVDPPDYVDSVTSDSHYYVLRVREFPLAPSEFYLFECDKARIVCRSILEPEDQSRAWNTNMTLSAEGNTVLILNNQRAVFTHTP